MRRKSKNLTYYLEMSYVTLKSVELHWATEDDDPLRRSSDMFRVIFFNGLMKLNTVERNVACLQQVSSDFRFNSHLTTCLIFLQTQY